MSGSSWPGHLTAHLYVDMFICFFLTLFIHQYIGWEQILFFFVVSQDYLWNAIDMTVFTSLKLPFHLLNTTVMVSVRAFKSLSVYSIV
jgi:hypothetical protein